MHTRQIDHPTYIETEEQLSHFCGQWSQAEILALDTEFIRTDTFYPIGALIQVSDGKGCYLIDPLTIDDFSSFKSLLIDPSIVKVLHACSEDLEVFEQLFDTLPKPLIDTQIAAALDGLGFSLSYQGLTEALLQVHVPKGETRSNWLQRPLTGSQIHYAALDVFYLPEIYRILEQSLRDKGRLEWLQRDSEQLLNKSATTDELGVYYKKIKSAWKLTRQQLGTLKLLIEWRELTAREKDVPRGRVLKDRCCFEIARQQCNSLHELSAINEVGPKTVRRYGNKILSIIKQSQSLTADQLPSSLPAPLPSSSNKVIKILKSHVKYRSNQLKMAPEMLARNKDYEALLRSIDNTKGPELPDSLAGWRKDVIGNELLSLVIQEL